MRVFNKAFPKAFPLRQGIAVAGVIAVALIIFQITPLFWNRPFFLDWINHVWTVEYYSAYLKHHGLFPTTIDVTQGFGNPLPIFYGVFFYPLLSVLSIIPGGDLAVRISSGALLLAPMISFAVLFHSFTKNLTLATFLSVTVNSSVYQLTNLYARSALTEFVAFQLLLLSISLVFYGLTRRSRIGNSAISLGFACATLSLGAHPITFYTFSLFVGPLLLLGCFSLSRVLSVSQLLRAVFWAVCAFFTLLPWAFTTLKYRGDLHITTTSALAGKVHYFPASIDSLWGKLGLFYVDSRVLTEGIGATSTPFLDAPFAPGLILVLSAMFWRLVSLDKTEFLRLVIPSVMAIFAIIYSVLPPQGVSGVWPDSIYATAENGLLYKLLVPLQFIYRLAGTFSLCMTVALLAALAALSRIGKPGTFTPSLIVVAYIGALIALSGAGQKLYVTYAEFIQYPAHRLENLAPSSPPKYSIEEVALLMKRKDYEAIARDVSSYPVTYYGSRDYTMPRIFPSSTLADSKGRKLVDVRVAEYGKSIPIVCDQACVLHTNIVPSKFQQILIDGHAPEDIKVSSDGNLEFLLQAGEHTLQIDKTGKLVRYVSASVWTMLFWFLLSSIVFVGSILAKISSRNRSGDVPLN